MILREKIDRIRNGVISAERNVENFFEVIEKKNPEINAFISLNPDALNEARSIDKKIKSGNAGKLAGLAIGVKSNICVKGLPITCASETLRNYIGTFDADVIKKIKAEDGIIIGMLNMDEFASGSTGEMSAFGATKNPRAIDRVAGGSSAGSAASVAAGMCDLSLGSDTGGSIRNPASNCGVAGVKPSYGLISRYGLIDLAMSLEGIGSLANEAYGCALLLDVIAGKSQYDAVTTFSHSADSYVKNIDNPIKNIRIGVIDEVEELCADRDIYELIDSSTKEFAAKTKSEIKNIKLKYIKLAIQTYYPITYVEFFSGTRKFDGRKYGKKIEDNCGEEVLRRILGGEEISKAEYRGRYYRTALKAKQLIANEFEEAFGDVDIIMLPTVPKLPHKLGTKINDPREIYAYDAFTIPANLAGICAGVVNAGFIQKIPVGIQFMAPRFKDDFLLQVMNNFEKNKK